MDSEGSVIGGDIEQGGAFFEADLAVVEEGEVGRVAQAYDFAGLAAEFQLHPWAGLCGLAFEEQGSGVFICLGVGLALGVALQPFGNFEFVPLLLWAVLLGLD